jgi:23S rRNA (guanosine2251-2'-O)-methyltransferase
VSAEHYTGGWHVVLAALESDAAKPLEILIVAGRQDERSRRVQALAQQMQIPLRTVSRGDLDIYAPGIRHQGVVARMPARELSGEEALEQPAAPESLILALDGVQDPHNLGACLRTAEATGVTAVLIPKDRSASLTPAAQKASAGASERVPLIAVTNLVRSLKRLQELGYWVTGLAGEGAEPLYDADLTGPLVLVLGAEGEGMRRLTRETCDRLVRIPMRGRIESLNVSVAAGVCLYEAFRQRSAGNGRPQLIARRVRPQ